MRDVRVARRYARALMAAAEHQKNIEGTAKDLDLVGKALNESRELRLFVASPVISAAKKRKVFDELLATRVGKETLSFVHLLTVKSREGLLPEVIQQFKELQDEKQGIVNVELRSVVDLTNAQEKDIRSQLERKVGKKVRLHLVTDKALKGGLLVKVGDTVFDASVVHQLERIRERFIAGRTA
jgi:F-type H+-transporting ATPase subunit delta